MSSRIFLASSFVLALSGCTTTLTHEHLSAGTQPSEPGFSYYLPRQRLAVTATYELKSCPNATGDATAAARPLLISQTISIAESPVADPKELYSIPLKSLSAAWKTTSLTATVYDNQTIHTVGVTADDRTGAVVKGVIGTALSVARIVVGVPTAARVALCQPGVYQALDVVREGQAKLLDPSVEDSLRARWSGLVAAARSSLQISETYMFDPSPTELEMTGQPQPTKLINWFSNPQLIATASDADKKRYEQAISTHIRLSNVPANIAAIGANLKGQGVIYREPAPVVVHVCAGSCKAPGTPEVKANLLATLETQAAQFGRYAVIPLVNMAFQKNNLSLSFEQMDGLRVSRTVPRAAWRRLQVRYRSLRHPLRPSWPRGGPLGRELQRPLRVQNSRL